MSDTILDWWGINSRRLFYQLNVSGAGNHIIVPAMPEHHIILLGFSMTASKNTRVRGTANGVPITAWFGLKKDTPWQRDSFWGVAAWPRGTNMGVQNESNTLLGGIFLTTHTRNNYIGNVI